MNSSLSADRPQTDPAQDLLGYAPFAETLTKALCNYGSSDPLVLGLYGAWGSGKSTILKFICHNLKEIPEDERPIVIEFNPWWFSGQEHLARAFLGQLQAVLPKKNEAFKELGEMLGNFSEGIGGLLDLAGITGGMGEKAGALIKTFTERPPKDVPALKKEICDILQLSEKRIVIMIDDIDRLEAEEMRQLFTVIKALADFPNVIYLLAFDMDVVVRAIEKSSGMPGREYLEKIIQVPFVVPQVDRTVLLDGLKTRLDEILEGTPEELYEQTRWRSFFSDGIDSFFTVPRDVVRFCNTVSVTYPAVRGEVNAVDFIVIEAIRVFLPKLYMYIRDNLHEFVGVSFGKGLSEQQLENILNNFVSEDMYHKVERILKLLFPYIVDKRAIAQPCVRRLLPVGHREISPSYFRFYPSPKTISNTEMMQWLKKAGDADAFGLGLLQAGERAQLFLNRLQDYIDKDIRKEHIPVIITALLSIADKLSSHKRLIIKVIGSMLLNIEPKHIFLIFAQNVRSGRALDVQYNILIELIGIDKDVKVHCFKYKIIYKSIESGMGLSAGWLDILPRWHKEGLPRIKNLCVKATKKDTAMLAFIKNFSHSASYITPDYMKYYIDVADFESRILALRAGDKIPQEYEETANLFLQRVALWREGKTSENA